MRILFVLLAFVLSVPTAVAETITLEQARQRAAEFMAQQNDRRQLTAVVNRTKLMSRKRAAQKTADEYYVFNKGTREGYVIVSGDDRTVPVLGYCDQGEFDYEQLPPAMQDWIEDYARQIRAIRAGAPVLKLPANHPRVETFMDCKWSQGSPYNNLCPLDAGSRSVTGCVATAMAQILYYNREKSVTETTADIPGYTTATKNINVAGIAAGAPIDWANMKDTYNSATELQKRAVAQLMLYCGVAVEMDYTNGSSGAQIYRVADACKKYFGYGNSVKYIESFRSEDEMDQIVYSELAAGRPVYLGGYTGDWSVGHAFLTCGYENQRYWINWGWGGQSDGYYYLTNLTPGDGQGIGGSSDGYNSGKTCIIGFEPENFGEKAMSFSDAAVKKICVDRWDANGDGTLTYGEAAAVTDLGDAFKGNTAIKKFPELHYFSALTSIADGAFEGCALLASIRLPKNIKRIGENAFKDCQKLPQINMPTGVSEIGSGAFDGCKLLEAFELPVGLSVIEPRTFRNCAAITAVSLPINVETIKSEAFAGCTKLKNFYINTYRTGNLKWDEDVFSGIDLSKSALHVMQGTKAFYEAVSPWKEFGTLIQTRDVSGGKFTTLETGNTYFLYNVGTGRYLTKGEAYKTQAVVGTEPMRFKFVHPTSKPEGVYYITSPDTGNEGKYLFRTETNDYVGNGVKATFVDGRTLNNSAYWKLTATETDLIYTIQNPDATAEEAGKDYLGVQTDHESNSASPTYGVYWDVTLSANSMWQFVLYDERQTQTFTEAEILAKLLSTAKKKGVMMADEQAVYDNLESTVEELKAAQSSLRKKLKFIEFYHQEVREQCITYFDSDTDGELSYKEASDITDFGWLFSFMNNTNLVHVDELQYFTNVQYIYGNFMQGCVNLESVVLPKSLEKIYYWAFKGCKKLKAIKIPDYVNMIGENAFEGCTSLQSVSLGAPDPSLIELGNDIFSGVNLKNITLYVPFGSKELYEKAPVWKGFGKIVEVRGHAQPKYSAIKTDVQGYVMNLRTRKYITMGEAYGTQSVVALKGMLYQFKHPSTMGDSIYYLASDNNILFRTSTDTRVGDGVKACFGDGTLSKNAYWRLISVGDNVYRLQVPETDASYVAGDYLGVNEGHASSAASPTYGLYWDVKNGGIDWVFVRTEDLAEANAIDAAAELLATTLARAKEAGIDTAAEQAVYDNVESTADELNAAVASLRSKLGYITFAEEKVKSVCVNNWDADGDGELSFEEAAAVTDIGEVFRSNSNFKQFEELRYFTSLKEIKENAFRGDMALQVIYLPASVESIGEYAFTQCSDLRYVAILNDKDVVKANGVIGFSSSVTLFVPQKVQEAYLNDASWQYNTILEYTGKPVVTAEATRLYGRMAATVSVKVSGAPVMGTPEWKCDEIAESTTPVGTYPIVMSRGTVATTDVEFLDGVFTVTPAALTVTAKSYTRQVGEPNPEFELTYRGFRNREKEDDALTVKPTVTCEATADSPAGEYAIIVSGGMAPNYEITYVEGKLTVEVPSGISEVKGNGQSEPVYDLQGRRVDKARKGVYVSGRRKVVVK